MVKSDSCTPAAEKLTLKQGCGSAVYCNVLEDLMKIKLKPSVATLYDATT
jgi:hypothetical protein